FGIRDIPPAELGLPVVQRRFRHPVLPAEFRSLRASLMLPQHCDDLFFRKPASLHRSVPCSGRTLTPRGGISQWQVSHRRPQEFVNSSYKFKVVPRIILVQRATIPSVARKECPRRAGQDLL